MESVFLYPKENAKNHHTEKYELVTDQDTAVVRRAAKFNLAIKTGSRAIDLDEQDNVNLIFDFGKFIFYFFDFFLLPSIKKYIPNIYIIKFRHTWQ